jgi:hypothetical protein
MKTLSLRLICLVLLGTLFAADKPAQKEVESNAVGTMRSINTAERFYAKTYTDRGYACDLDALLIGPAPREGVRGACRALGQHRLGS